MHSREISWNLLLSNKGIVKSSLKKWLHFFKGDFFLSEKALYHVIPDSVQAFIQGKRTKRSAGGTGEMRTVKLAVQVKTEDIVGGKR